MEIRDSSMSKENKLRKLIVKRTSEMLDNPNECSIYKTSDFYNNLEQDIRKLLFEERHSDYLFIADLLMDKRICAFDALPQLEQRIIRYDHI